MSRECSDTGSLASHSGFINVEAARLWGSQGSGTGWGWGIRHEWGLGRCCGGPWPAATRGPHLVATHLLSVCCGFARGQGRRAGCFGLGSLGASAVT